MRKLSGRCRRVLSNARAIGLLGFCPRTRRRRRSDARCPGSVASTREPRRRRSHTHGRAFLAARLPRLICGSTARNDRLPPRERCRRVRRPRRFRGVGFDGDEFAQPPKRNRIGRDFFQPCPARSLTPSRRSTPGALAPALPLGPVDVLVEGHQIGVGMHRLAVAPAHPDRGRQAVVRFPSVRLFVRVAPAMPASASANGMSHTGQ